MKNSRKNLWLENSVGRFSRVVRFPGREYLLRKFFDPNRYLAVKHPDFWYEKYDRNISILCNLGSYIEWSIFFKGYYQQDLAIVIKKLIKPGMVCLDVGANIGAFTLLMAKTTGRQGKVYAFEPYSQALERLTSNINKNKMNEQVEILGLGLSDTSGEGKLFVPRKEEFNQGISSFHRKERLTEEGFSVSLIRLDDFIKNQQIKRVDFIKIDTEGWDDRVLRGGVETIKVYLPIIIFEANPIHKDALNDFMENLYNFGYSFYRVGYFGRLIPLRNICDKEVDVVCLPRKE